MKIRERFDSLLMTLDRLFRGPPISVDGAVFVRNILLGGFLRDFIANPTKFKDEAGPSISRSEWWTLYFVLRQLTPEILTHEELDKIDQALSGGLFGEELNEMEVTARNNE